MAFLAGGHQPGRGQYGANVTRALKFILSKEGTPPGFLYNASSEGNSHGPMYSHGFGALFLAESHGTVQDRELRRRVRDTLGRAVQVILASQNDGGWRYLPKKNDADISVTVCQIMALRSARNAGVEVPKSAVDECVKYVRLCQRPDGGFSYYKQGSGSGFARTSAGLAALYSAGIYQDKAIDRGLAYMVGHRPSGQGYFRSGDSHYYYGHYYAAQVMWTAGGRYWSDWFPAVREELLARARVRGDGGWTDPNYGTDYATAMACIILQIPNNYLPILQK
jgi:hypothetical protein